MHQGSGRCLVVAALLATSACQIPQVAPPSAALRQSFGLISLASSTEPTLKPVAPPEVVGAGAGAGAGALAGIGGSVEAGGRDSFPGGLIVGILLAPVAGVVGAVAGAAMAPTDVEVSVAQARIGNVWSRATPSASLAQAFIERAQSTGWRVLPSDDGTSVILIPTSSGPDTAQSANTRLQIGVEALELAYEGSFDPDVHIVLRTFARFSTVADGMELYRANWTVVRKTKSYFALSEQPGELQAQIGTAAKDAAESMARFLFIAPSEVPAQQTINAGTITIETKAGNKALPPTAPMIATRSPETHDRSRAIG